MRSLIISMLTTMWLLSLGCQATPPPRGEKTITKLPNGNYEVSPAKIDEINQDFALINKALEACLANKPQTSLAQRH